MQDAVGSHPDPLPEGTASRRTGRFEGWFALVMVGLFLATTVVGPRLPYLVGDVIGLVAFAMGLLLGWSGARRGRGGERVAALLALSVLGSLIAIVMLIILNRSRG